MMDGQEDIADEVFHLLKGLRTPVTLYEMGIDPDSPSFLAAVESVPGQPDMRCLPFMVTGQMVLEAVKKMEHLYGSYGLGGA
jgi:hypothetical protein